MMVKIKKYMKQADGRAREQVVSCGPDLSTVMEYARIQRALVAQDGTTLHVLFNDGATCQTEFPSEDNLTLWLRERLATCGRIMKQSDGIAQFKVVVVDESQNWNPELVGRAGGKIYSTYLYNAREPVYCCELTPSFALTHLFDSAEAPLDDQIEEEIMEGSAGADQDTYMHCSRVAQLPEVHDFGVELVDEADEVGRPLQEIADDCQEWAQGNRGGLETPRDAPSVQMVMAG